MHVLRFACFGILLTFGLQSASAQDDGEESNDASLDRGPERCISLDRVDRTEVIDDRTIVFHMRNGGIYLNNLETECPGLKREERFMYSPTSNRLCNIDTVTVLENLGFGLTRGFTCTLGRFHPISDADLGELKRGAGEGEDEGGDIEVEPVDPDELEEVLENERRGDVEVSSEDDAANE